MSKRVHFAPQYNVYKWSPAEKNVSYVATRGKTPSKGRRVGCQRDQHRAAVRMSLLSGPSARELISFSWRSSLNPKTPNVYVYW